MSIVVVDDPIFMALTVYYNHSTDKKTKLALLHCKYGQENEISFTLLRLQTFINILMNSVLFFFFLIQYKNHKSSKILHPGS